MSRASVRRVRGAGAVLIAGLALYAVPAVAQSSATPSASIGSIKQAFDAAWARQPEAQAAAARRDAALARREAAGSLFAEPPSGVLSAKTDQLTRNQGNREYEAGLAMPLWLPNERARTQALSDSELSAVESRVLAAQLRTAATVRDAFWGVQRARVEAEVAQARLKNASQLAADVARRVKAGDLARADQHQAEGAVAGAAASLAEAQSVVAQSTQLLRALVGAPVSIAPAGTAEPIPTDDGKPSHPAVQELSDRAEIARRAKALAAVQKRANPELTVGTTRERGASGDAYAHTLNVGVRFPFGSDSRNRSRMATAAAEEIEAETQFALERDRIAASIDAARVRLDATRAQVAAAERRATLARESRGFFEKSFALGETDLPTRLRIDLEAFEAERQAARVRIEEASAISQLRQALGLLPQ